MAVAEKMAAEKMAAELTIQWHLGDALRLKRGDQTWKFNLGDIISFLLRRTTLFFRIEEFFVMGGNIILLGVYWDQTKNVQKNMPFIRVLSVTCPCNFSNYVPIDDVKLVYSAAAAEESWPEENWRVPVEPSLFKKAP